MNVIGALKGLGVVGLAVMAFASAACGGSSSSTSGETSEGSGGSKASGGHQGGGGSGGGGGSASCPVGSHVDGSGCAVTLDGWTQGPSLAHARDHHVTFIAETPAGNFLYVAAGINATSIFNGIERAPIAADGTLGAFTAAGTIPKGVAGAGLAQVGNAVVMAGGLAIETSNAVSVTDTAVGVVADDGTVTFTAGPSLASSRYHVSLSADRGFVYAIGGLEQSVVSGQPEQHLVDAIERAPFDGKTLGAFTTLAPLPAAMTHQAAVVRDHYIYLIGGITDETPIKDVQRSLVSESGDLGAWEKVGELPEGRGTSSAFVFVDQLYVLCGANKAQGGEVATVLRASFQPDGSVGTFEELTPVPMARAHVHQTPLLNGFIYSAGGSLGSKYENEVYLGKLE